MTATKTEVPCRGCGTSTDQRVTTQIAHDALGRPKAEYGAGVCDACLDLDIDAEGSAVRAALRVIGKPERDWRLAAGVFAEHGLDVTPVLYAKATPQRRAFDHVPKEVRTALKTAYLAVLDAKVHASTDHDRPVPPTGPPDDTEHRGCLFCGLAKQSEPWRGPITTTALVKPGMVTGYLCTPCGEATEEAGAIGAPAMERAVMTAHGYEWTENVTIPGLRAWVSTGMGPLEQPWLWVDLREPVPEIEPLVLLHQQLAELTAKVEALEVRAGS